MFLCSTGCQVYVGVKCIGFKGEWEAEPPLMTLQGAMMGLAVEWGIKRGIYANEAGQGSGPHAGAPRPRRGGARRAARGARECRTR